MCIRDRIYIQVSDNISGQETFEREVLKKAGKKDMITISIEEE